MPATTIWPSDSICTSKAMSLFVEGPRFVVTRPSPSKVVSSTPADVNRATPKSVRPAWPTATIEPSLWIAMSKI
jgi:hypothetical protein